MKTMTKSLFVPCVSLVLFNLCLVALSSWGLWPPAAHAGAMSNVKCVSGGCTRCMASYYQGEIGKSAICCTGGAGTFNACEYSQGDNCIIKTSTQSCTGCTAYADEDDCAGAGFVCPTGGGTKNATLCRGA